MKRTYLRLRTVLMTFTLGIAAVYTWNGGSIGWSEVPVDLPTAVSESVFVVFPDTSYLLTREKNCGKDPRDAQERLDCESKRLFGDRDMSLYAKFEITCDARQSTNPGSTCGYEEAAHIRKQVWHHWSARSRGHIVVDRLASTFDHGRDHETHYFIEPDHRGRWRLVSKYRYFADLVVDGEDTPVGFVDEHPSTYTRARWKLAKVDEAPWDVAPGTRYLEFANATELTVHF